MPALPTGTVTFLFSDIEGSTRSRKLGRDGYERVQDEHAALVREAAVTAGDGGSATEGDAFFVVFRLRRARPSRRRSPTPRRAPMARRRDDPGADGPTYGRGIAEGDDYVGLDVNRAARWCDHGGQIVMTEATRVLLSQDLPDGATIRNLGGHRLKDLEDSEQLHDVVVDGLPSAFPPLRSIDTRRTNLPSRRTSFVGRDDLDRGDRRHARRDAAAH